MTDLDYTKWKDNQALFLDMLDEVCETTPERINITLKKMEKEDFYIATGYPAAVLLEHALSKRIERGISTYIYFYGPGQSGKSTSAIILAWLTDPGFTAENIVFDLAELSIKIPTTRKGAVYVVDDVRERYGEGSQMEKSNVIAFLEQCFKSGVNVFFCSIEQHIQRAMNYIVEIIGVSFSKSYALGMVYDAEMNPVGWVTFHLENEIRPIVERYDVKKEDFVNNVLKRGGGSPAHYEKQVEQLMDEIDFSYCDTAQDYVDEIMEFNQTVTQRRAKILARRIMKRRKKEQKIEAIDKVRITSDEWVGEAPEGLLQELINMAEWNHLRHKEAFQLYSVEGFNKIKIAEHFKTTERSINRWFGEADRVIGLALEEYLERNQPLMWERQGGKGSPDLVNKNHNFVISVKVRRGDKKVIGDAIKDSSIEMEYVKKGWNGYLLLFLSNKNTIYIRELKDSQTN